MIPAAILLIALVAGLLIGAALDRTEARRLAHRRQVLAQLVSVDAAAAARRRHPSRLS